MMRNKPSLPARLALAAFALLAAGTLLFYSTTKAQNITVRVLSAQGAPVENLTIFASELPKSAAHFYWSLTQGTPPAALVQISNPEGEVDLNLAEDREYGLSASGHGKTTGPTTFSGARTRKRLQLVSESYTLALTLKAQDTGELIEGAVLSVYSRMGHQVAMSTSGQDGLVEAELSPGQYFIKLEASDYAPTTRSMMILADDIREYHLQRPRSFQVKLPSQISAQLAVLHSTGALVSEHQVAVGQHLKIAHLPPGQYLIWATSAAGEILQKHTVAPSNDQKGAIESIQLGAWEPHGQPLNVQLPDDCTPALQAYFKGPGGTLSGYEPRFVLSGEPGSRLIELKLPPINAQLSVACGELVTWALVEKNRYEVMDWTPTLRIEGHVDALNDTNMSLTELFLSDGKGFFLPAGHARDDGTFSLMAPQMPELRLIARHPRFGDVPVSLEGAMKGQALSLSLSAGHFIEGRIANQEGLPLADVTVAYTSQGGGNNSTLSSKDGTFRVGPLRQGQGYLLAFADGKTIMTAPQPVKAAHAEEIRLVADLH